MRQLASSEVLHTLLLQVAAAQNRALEQPLQPDALFSSAAPLNSTPSIADLQREHEQQYGYGYDQLPGQQQQQVMDACTCAFMERKQQSLAQAAVACDTARDASMWSRSAGMYLKLSCMLIDGHCIKQYAYMPQQSMPQQPAAAGQYQPASVGMYSSAQQQVPQAASFSGGLYTDAGLQQTPAALQPLQHYLPTSFDSLGMPPDFPGLQTASGSMGSGGSARGNRGGHPGSFPSYGLGGMPPFQAAASSGGLQIPSFGGGSGDLRLPRQDGVSGSGSSGNVHGAHSWDGRSGAVPDSFRKLPFRVRLT